MDIHFDPAFFVGMTLVAYVLNVAAAAYRGERLDLDRWCLRAPIVAVLATVLYGPVTLAGTVVLGIPVLLYITVKDITPGHIRAALNDTPTTALQAR